MKKGLVVLAVLLIFAGVVKVFWWDERAATKEIESAFFSENYLGYLQEIAKNGRSIPSDQMHLLRAYGYTALGDFKKSNLELDKALSQKGISAQIKLEVTLNQALNSYLQKIIPLLNMILRGSTDP